jgi:hypothetical protein
VRNLCGFVEETVDFNPKSAPMDLPTGCRSKWRTRDAFQHYPRYFLFGALVLACPGAAMAEPPGGTVTGGSGTISQIGRATTNIHQSTQLKIDWSSFNIGANESGSFHQPNMSGIATIRVLPRPMSVPGAMGKFGRKFPSLRGRIVATGRQSSKSEEEARVEIPGAITALLSHNARSPGKTMTLDLRGDGLITFSVNAKSVANIAADGKLLGIDNAGMLTARSGEIAMTPATVSQAMKSVVNLVGVVDADAFMKSVSGGKTLFASSGGSNGLPNMRAEGDASIATEFGGSAKAAIDF